MRALIGPLLVLCRGKCAVRHEGDRWIQDRGADQGQQPVLRVHAGDGLAALRTPSRSEAAASAAGDAHAQPSEGPESKAPLFVVLSRCLN
jgi:hypothetical protein